MTTTPIVLVWVIFGLTIVFLLFFSIKQFLMIKRLAASFAKLGFVVREDAKKYFDDASATLVTTNQEFKQAYTDIVANGTKQALAESATDMEQVLAGAQNEAGNIVLQAREDARRITLAARTSAAEETARSLDGAADTISWVMGKYIQETYSVEQHKALIDKLIEEYIHEHRDSTNTNSDQ